MNTKINDFIEKQSCATICCTTETGLPHCFSCYYVFNKLESLLYFKSSPGSLHSQLLKAHHEVAGTILPDKISRLHIHGIQFSGTVLNHEDLLVREAVAHYYVKNPAALAMPGEVYVIRIEQIKYTDSTLGIGKKMIWKRGEDVAFSYQ